MVRSSHSTAVRSRWFVGSSRSRTSGRETSDRASEARVSSPPEKPSSGRGSWSSSMLRPRSTRSIQARHA